MSILPPIFGPREAGNDLIAFLRRRSREQTIGAILAVLVTVIIVLVFFIDPKVNTAPGATITYVESWDADRSDEEIIAQQQADMKAAEEARRLRQEEYRELSNQLGIE
ncbi:hypothetical protein [Sphingomicrobium lutaoense]|uniref:Uncharacterized protein n=1 Tax=Sphingomicrobium lutaoense TaxID=515949 RepID=A0A839Z5D8_9SPHN|nr:hypothetical protein [Sphingomicrobium lutaoense]MBB3764832.1 hypothetical protein [Sphingomicrobium lutaoense]